MRLHRVRLSDRRNSLAKALNGSHRASVFEHGHFSKRCFMNLDRVKERIAKLLRVAKDDAATQGEIDNAIRAARYLMMEYHVEEADLAAAGSPEPAMGQATKKTRYAKIPAWEQSLAAFVARLVGGVCWYKLTDWQFREGRYKCASSITYFGAAEDAALAAEVYEELATAIVVMAVAKYGGAYRGDGGMYAEGFVAGLCRQLSQMNGDLRSTGTDLATRSSAIVEAKRQRAKEWLATTQGIRLVTAPRPRGAGGSLGAYDRGKMDGREYDTSGVGGRRDKLAPPSKLLEYCAHSSTND
jgi:hypothetical protein